MSRATKLTDAKFRGAEREPRPGTGTADLSADFIHPWLTLSHQQFTEHFKERKKCTPHTHTHLGVT